MKYRLDPKIVVFKKSRMKKGKKPKEKETDLPPMPPMPCIPLCSVGNDDDDFPHLPPAA